MTVWFRCAWCHRIEPYPAWISRVIHAHGGSEYTCMAFRTRRLARVYGVGK